MKNIYVLYSCCKSIHMSVYLSVSLYICQSIYLSVYLSVCLSICKSINLSNYFSLYLLTISLSIYNLIKHRKHCFILFKLFLSYSFQNPKKIVQKINLLLCKYAFSEFPQPNLLLKSTSIF